MGCADTRRRTPYYGVGTICIPIYVDIILIINDSMNPRLINIYSQSINELLLSNHRGIYNPYKDSLKPRHPQFMRGYNHSPKA